MRITGTRLNAESSWLFWLIAEYNVGSFPPRISPGFVRRIPWPLKAHRNRQVEPAVASDLGVALLGTRNYGDCCFLSSNVPLLTRVDRPGGGRNRALVAMRVLAGAAQDCQSRDQKSRTGWRYGTSLTVLCSSTSSGAIPYHARWLEWRYYPCFPPRSVRGVGQYNELYLRKVTGSMHGAEDPISRRDEHLSPGQWLRV